MAIRGRSYGIAFIRAPVKVFDRPVLESTVRIHEAASRRPTTRSFLLPPRVVNPAAVVAPLAPPVTIREAASRRPRPRSFLLPPAVVSAAVVAPLAPSIRVDLGRGRRPATRSFLRPPVALAVFAAARIFDVQGRRPRVRSLFTKTNVALPSGAVRPIIVANVHLRPVRTKTFLLPPRVVNPAPLNRTRTELAASRRPRTISRLRPPTVIGTAAPAVTTIAVSTVENRRRPRITSFLRAPVVVSTAVAAPADPVVTRASVSTVENRPRPKIWSFLRAPVVVGPYVAPTGPPVVTATRVALAPSRVPSRRPHTFLRLVVYSQPTAQQESVFAPRPAPTRYQARTRSFLGKPIVAAAAVPPVVTTITVKVVRGRRPSVRSVVRRPTVLAVFKAARVTLVRGRRPVTRSRFVGPVKILPVVAPVVTKTRVTLAKSRRPVVRAAFVRPSTLVPRPPDPVVTTTRVSLARIVHKPVRWLIGKATKLSLPGPPVVTKTRTKTAPSRRPHPYLTTTSQGIVRTGPPDETTDLTAAVCDDLSIGPTTDDTVVLDLDGTSATVCSETTICSEYLICGPIEDTVAVCDDLLLTIPDDVALYCSETTIAADTLACGPVELT